MSIPKSMSSESWGISRFHDRVCDRANGLLGKQFRKTESAADASMGRTLARARLKIKSQCVIRRPRCKIEYICVNIYIYSIIDSAPSWFYPRWGPQSLFYDWKRRCLRNTHTNTYTAPPRAMLLTHMRLSDFRPSELGNRYSEKKHDGSETTTSVDATNFDVI